MEYRLVHFYESTNSDSKNALVLFRSTSNLFKHFLFLKERPFSILKIAYEGPVCGTNSNINSPLLQSMKRRVRVYFNILRITQQRPFEFIIRCIDSKFQRQGRVKFARHEISVKPIANIFTKNCGFHIFFGYI